jgi:hypothetical protein
VPAQLSAGTPLARWARPMDVSALPSLSAESSPSPSSEAGYQSGQSDFSALLFLILTLPRAPEGSDQVESGAGGEQALGTVQTTADQRFTGPPMMPAIGSNTKENLNRSAEAQALASLPVGPRPFVGLAINATHPMVGDESAVEVAAGQLVNEIESPSDDPLLHSKDVAANAGSKDAPDDGTGVFPIPNRASAPEVNFSTSIEKALAQFNARRSEEGGGESFVRIAASPSRTTIRDPGSGSPADSIDAKDSEAVKSSSNDAPDFAIPAQAEHSPETRSQATLIAKIGYAVHGAPRRTGGFVNHEANLPAGENNRVLRIVHTSTIGGLEPRFERVENPSLNSPVASRIASTWLESSTGARSLTDPSAVERAAAELVQASYFVAGSPGKDFFETATHDFATADYRQMPAFDLNAMDGEKDSLSTGVSGEPPHSTAVRLLSNSMMAPVEQISTDIPSINWRPVVERVASEIVARIRVHKREAVIQLDPPELGKITIDLQIDGDKLHARVMTEGQDAKHIIEHHIHELRQSLQAQQLDLVEFRIDQGDWANARDDFLNRQRQQGSHGHGEWQSSSSAPSVERNEKNDFPRLPRGGRVSMWA